MRRPHPPGSALVIVLGFLLLATVLVIAFFSTVTVESTSADSYAKEISTRQMADSALQYVMGTIREATSQGNQVAWASQPGMIRTYGGTTTGSTPLAYYKLYSSNNMVVSGAQFPFDPFASDFDSAWRSKPVLWSDLNSPVSTSGTAEFPIIDGKAIKRLTRNAAGETVSAYYGYDADENGLPDIDGFAVDPAIVSYSPGAALSSSNTPVPMPVRWIYVLQDGALTVPDSVDADGKTARWTGATSSQPKPSKKNPIVGRMAFWTDDETSKLNLNTASEGGYWDSPRFSSAMDLAMGRCGPAQREYNRYPGHPAGVSLSPVLGTALGLPQPTRFSLQSTVSSPPVGKPATWDPVPKLVPGVDQYLKNLFSISPRFVWGGSRMGTQATAPSITGAAGIAKADLRLDRLYATVDELLYAPPQLSDTSRPVNATLTGTIKLTDQQLEMTRFFLTVSSRAPDLNPFDQPKICIWPIDDPTIPNPSNDYAGGAIDTRSPLDKTIAFCSTINGKPYYFTRNGPLTPVADFTQRNSELYDYLVNRLSTPIPGYGASFSSRYPGKQTAQIVTEIYDFIRGATNISDSTAEGGNRYLYSFSKPFLNDPAEKNSYKLARLEVGQVAPFTHPTNGTKGTGRFPTIQQAVILFIATAANQPPLQVDMSTGKPAGPYANPLHPYPNRVPTSGQISFAPTGSGTFYQINYLDYSPYPTISGKTHPGLRFLTKQNTSTWAYDQPNPDYSGPALQPGQTQIQAVLFFPMANPAAGNPCLVPHYKLRVSGADKFKAGGVSLNMRNGVKDVRADTPISSEVTTSGFVGYLAQVMGRTMGSNPQDLVFYSDPVIVNNSTAPDSYTFPFTGGEITLEVLNPADDSVVQTAKINFPDADFPTPILPTQNPYGPATNRPGQEWSSNPGVDQVVPQSAADFVSKSMLSLEYRFSVDPTLWPAAASVARTLIPRQARWDTSGYRFKLTCETVRSLEVPYGDTRLISCLKSIPSSLFVPHRYYFDKDMPSAHCLMGPIGLAGSSGMDKYPWVYRGAILEGLMDFYMNDPDSDVWLIYYLLGSDITRFLPAGTSPSLDKFQQIQVHNNGRHPCVNAGFPNVTSSASFQLTGASYTGVKGWEKLTPFATLWPKSGDYDNSVYNAAVDGPFINKPEEGISSQAGSNQNPYFGYDDIYSLVGGVIYSPNRQVASPVALGSLPAGIDPDDPKPEQAYRTLLFCPNPNGLNHPALGATPPDSALLDFFQMPVVEPYAISESFSTAGKVNMNYRIAPFSYIKRETAIRGVLRGVQLTAIEDQWLGASKFPDQLERDRFGAVAPAGYNPFRFPICEDDTLKEFEARFDKNDIFHFPSEICSLWLYPAQQTNISTASNPQKSLLSPTNSEVDGHAAIKKWWYTDAKGTRKAVTGDNVRETPYNHLYPRLTTKSNTYTVHVRVQKLQKLRNDPEQNTYKEGRDPSVGEFRGSFIVERYLDPSDATIPDFATNRTENLASHYRFRVLSSKQFGQ